MASPPVPGRRPNRAPASAALRAVSSVEGVPASARSAGVRVVDRESLLLDRVDEVDGGTSQVRPAHLVGHNLDPVEGADDVAVDLALVEIQLVAQARTAPWLDRDPQPEVITVFLRQQAADLGGRNPAKDDALSRYVVLNCHLVSSRSQGRRASGAAFLHPVQRYAKHAHSASAGPSALPG